MTEYAIIVAGGSGTRMQSETPKQFMLLAGKPILMHTIEAFTNYSNTISIILVLPSPEISTWKSLCEIYNFDIKTMVIEGGSSRFQSVKNGLNAIPDNDNGLVAIHDGVRPLVATEIISDSFRLSEIHGSAVASTKLKESLRQMDNDQSKSIDRSRYRSIQTPQTFKSKLIKKAYDNAPKINEYTDDSSVAEKAGAKIFLFEGSYENIKITTPEDLLFAEAIIKSKK